MTQTEGKCATAAVKDILPEHPEGLREVIRAVMQEMLQAEMDEALGAAKSQRSVERIDYRSGYYDRMSMAETKCAVWRCDSVTVGLKERG